MEDTGAMAVVYDAMVNDSLPPKRRLRRAKLGVMLGYIKQEEHDKLEEELNG